MSKSAVDHLRELALSYAKLVQDMAAPADGEKFVLPADHPLQLAKAFLNRLDAHAHFTPENGDEIRDLVEVTVHRQPTTPRSLSLVTALGEIASGDGRKLDLIMWGQRIGVRGFGETLYFDFSEITQCMAHDILVVLKPKETV
jgi:hypothetical protein